eukprot:7931466-Pyramimonas_sp.AAC.2
MGATHDNAASGLSLGTIRAYGVRKELVGELNFRVMRSLDKVLRVHFNSVRVEPWSSCDLLRTRLQNLWSRVIPQGPGKSVRPELCGGCGRVVHSVHGKSPPGAPSHSDLS